ncbi:E3 ubiquitin-protein ligase rififylin isoform X2 [Scleropages formosus]|uniref:E3 ubiquitin-protein ligase rififylin isoform X2 n=1 Tax=Scleropages formosus TaxID=113540 RepID=UPI0010FAC737|nr:E3 ubiquitin-protein ligase rififylin-like isoform X2 [Scleropages formosus]
MGVSAVHRVQTRYKHGMWTSCCRWFCADAAGTRVEDSTAARRTYMSSGCGRPPPASADVLCKACGGCFGTLTHKHVCVDCKKNFCSRCFVQLELRPRLCLTCQRFHRTLFDRAELMRLKVKDLLDYLHLHEVPTQTCREKEELVELVLGQRSPSSTSSGGEAVTQRGAPQRRTAAVATPPSPPAPVVLRPRSPEEDQAPFVPLASRPEDTPVQEEDTEAQEDSESQSSDVEENLVPGRRASLSDLSCVRDIEALSVRQLKEILARNFVSYAGCCEKWELMERVTRLFNEHKDLRRLASKSKSGSEKAPTQPALEENLCKICMDSPIDCVLLECGHMVTCSKCGKRMNECPICRQYVVRAVHVFRS